MKTNLRKAAVSDLEPLCTIARRTIAASYAPFLGSAVVTGFIESGASDRYVRDNLDDCSVIAVGGDVAGFCVCRDDRIDLMMIDHPLHRKGLGSQLLKHCEGALFKTNQTLRLESFEGNDLANAFYRKNGWHKAGIAFDDASGSRKIVFEKRRPGKRQQRQG